MSIFRSARILRQEKATQNIIDHKRTRLQKSWKLYIAFKISLFNFEIIITRQTNEVLNLQKIGSLEGH